MPLYITYDGGNISVDIATADRLDDDPAIDQWQKDDRGLLKVVVDDSKVK